MYDLKRSIRRHAVGCAGLLGLILVVASASRCTSDSVTGAENPGLVDTDPTGTILGTVTADGSPISGVEVWIGSLPALQASAITDVDGAFIFTLRAGGPYVVQLANDAGSFTTCRPASAMVEANRSVSVHIDCQRIGVMTGEVRWTDGASVSGVQVSLIGPVSRQTQASSQGRFRFSELPPGDYSVTPNAGCPSVTATIQAGQVTTVEVSCELPTLTEIEGDWIISVHPGSGYWDYDERVAQTGNCPPLLAAEGRGSIAFDAAANTVSIIGLDPDLTIFGKLDPAICREGGCTRAFSGTGTAVRPDGSSIQSNLSGSFHFSILDGGLSFWSTLTREHRLAGGELVCSELYSPGGTKLGG